MATIANIYPQRLVSPSTARFHWRLLEIFILIQFASSALLFVPGAQYLRLVVRALPYVSGLIMLVLFAGNFSRARSPGTNFLILALVLLFLELLHPATQFAPGLAQCVLQLCIASPFFWMDELVNDKYRLDRLLYVIFIVNALSASVGLLQTFYPDRFMPPEFNHY